MGEIEWTGDLDDDCVARWNGYMAHCEALDERSWYASVSAPDGIMLLHTAENDVVCVSGRGARWLCEQIMRGHKAQELLRRAKTFFNPDDWVITDQHCELCNATGDAPITHLSNCPWEIAKHVEVTNE